SAAAKRCTKKRRSARSGPSGPSERGVMTAQWDVLVEGLGRLEAPCLDLDGQLCFSDIADDGAIYRLRSDGHLETVVRGRHHVGGLVAHADGGFVATGSTVAVIDDRSERVVMTSEG